MQTISDSADDMVSGANTLKNTLAETQDTAAPLEKTAEETGQLLIALQQLSASAQTLCDNNDALTQGSSKLLYGIKGTPEQAGLITGISSLATGASALSDGVGQLAAGADQLKTGSQNLKTGASILIANNNKLNAGAAALSKGSADLLTGGLVLKSGADTLGTGIGQLADGAAALKEGTVKLADGGQDLKEGTGKLLDGATELADGMKEFDEEGIQELADVINIDLQDFLDRLQAVTDADKSYTAFDGTENGSGSVKFIIETAGIEIDD